MVIVGLEVAARARTIGLSRGTLAGSVRTSFAAGALVTTRATVVVVTLQVTTGVAATCKLARRTCCASTTLTDLAG